MIRMAVILLALALGSAAVAQEPKVPCDDSRCQTCLPKRVAILEDQVVKARKELGLPYWAPPRNRSLEYRVNWLTWQLDELKAARIRLEKRLQSKEA